MFKKISKTTFQDIHYLRKKPSFALKAILSIGEFFYKRVILIKNNLYEKGILKEAETKAFVICVGNLTTGGVGKTPITISLANELSKNQKVAVVSRGYGSKLNTKNPIVIKDSSGLKFLDGSECADEPFQIANKTNDNIVVIICKNRKKAIDFAINQYGIETVILDDGFSNRTIKKNRTIIVIDSKMRFGNKRLLPLGPLREPVEEIKRADEIILVNKGDNDLIQAIDWAKSFNKKITLCEMETNKIYNALTKAEIKTKDNNFNNPAIAFCAIGQPKQFFNYAKKYYNLKDCVEFCDHHKYTKNDIKKLVNLAKENKTNVLITTQKDETKIYSLIKNYTDFNFNVLELKNTFKEIN